ncbi:MAG: KpsF/GutQ family sugar-phosphate isomerase [bacterium]
MKKFKSISEIFRIEKDAIAENIKPEVTAAINKAVKIILKRKTGRVVVMGIGKSGLVARKIASTLSSTGTPSFFTHPGEAMHGDIGMLTKGDTVLALSFSGQVDELGNLAPRIKHLKVPLIAVTGGKNSPLAKMADCAICIKISRQACPFNIAPTASTTVMMVIGDALALALMQRKKLGENDLALLHPGGVLGKKLTMRVSDLMRKGPQNPKVTENNSVKDALFEMTRTRLGAVSIVDKKKRVIGFFTDGDLRRIIQTDPAILARKIKNVMTKKPFTITTDMPAWKAAQIITGKNFDNIPVVDNSGKLAGIIDERDLLTEGLLD